MKVILSFLAIIGIAAVAVAMTIVGVPTWLIAAFAFLAAAPFMNKVIKFGQRFSVSKEDLARERQEQEKVH